MHHAEHNKPSLGSEIPYRRSRLQKRTGSMVFDRRLDQLLSEVPEQSPSQAMPDEKNPLKRGQVT